MLVVEYLTEKEWQTLFSLIERATNLPDMTAVEKGVFIRKKAVACGLEGSLDEFIAEVSE